MKRIHKKEDTRLRELGRNYSDKKRGYLLEERRFHEMYLS
jgi:hypothetical protein